MYELLTLEVDLQLLNISTKNIEQYVIPPLLVSLNKNTHFFNT